jgi:small subunit ribosomal protein S20
VPNLADAKKRMKQSARNRARNRARKSLVKTETRRFQELLAGGDLQAAQKAFTTLTQRLDQVAAKRTLHKNTVARRKSRLARKLNALTKKA